MSHPTVLQRGSVLMEAREIRDSIRQHGGGYVVRTRYSKTQFTPLVVLDPVGRDNGRFPYVAAWEDGQWTNRSSEGYLPRECYWTRGLRHGLVHHLSHLGVVPIIDSTPAFDPRPILRAFSRDQRERPMREALRAACERGYIGQSLHGDAETTTIPTFRALVRRGWVTQEVWPWQKRWHTVGVITDSGRAAYTKMTAGATQRE